jgi:chemotaxis protein CheD
MRWVDGAVAPPPGQRQPNALPQFSHIRRYWDPQLETFAAKLLPGEYYVTIHAEMICTVLGSCVSACVRDRVLGIGGMNHFMLPLDRSQGASAWTDAASAATRYGNIAMEHLINDLLKAGARRPNLEFKLAGGGKVLAAMTDVGQTNIDFVRAYMRTEGFTVLGEDLGDVYPRKVYFQPSTGKVRVKKLVSVRNDTIYARERNYLQEVTKAPQAGSVELF